MSITECPPSRAAIRNERLGDGQGPVTRRNLSELVVERIRQLVVQEGLGPGDALPAVIKLSATYEVSTTCVREALKKLEALGLVRGVQRRGFVLVEPTVAPLLEWVNFSTEGDRERYLDLLMARSALEPAIMPLVVEAATDEDYERLQQLLEQTVEAQDDWDTYNEREADFHRALYEATHNTALQAFGQMCCECFDIPHEAEDTAAAMAESIIEHGALVNALRAGDVQTAQQIAREHIRIRPEIAEENLVRSAHG